MLPSIMYWQGCTHAADAPTICCMCPMLKRADLSSWFNEWIWHICAEPGHCALCRLSSWWQPPSSGAVWRVQQLLRGQHLSCP